MNAPVRVLLVDDSDEVLTALRSWAAVHDDIEVLGVARSGEEALLLTRELRPDVVTMDVRLPKMNGFTATRAIKEMFPETRVVILTLNDDSAARSMGALAGAYAVLSKSTAAEGLYELVTGAATRPLFSQS
jgi:two-component system nitrate/nitrite response regulator NarL